MAIAGGVCGDGTNKEPSCHTSMAVVERSEVEV